MRTTMLTTTRNTRNTRTTRTTARRILVPLGLAGAGVFVAAPAFAHVTISPAEGSAGSYTVATVSVPHGCDGSATTKLAIQVPEQILSVTPTRNPFWDVQKVMTKLDEPVTDAHGNEVTERVGQIVYTAKTPLPDGQRDGFELSFQVPDAVGETLAFATVQTCEKGETAWVETTEAGAEEPEHPAPSFTVTAAAEGDGHGAGRAEGAEGAEEKTEAVSPDDSSGVAWAGVGVGALGLAAGATALARGRKQA